MSLTVAELIEQLQAMPADFVVGAAVAYALEDGERFILTVCAVTGAEADTDSGWCVLDTGEEAP